jgi:hypothetical protein
LPYSDLLQQKELMIREEKPPLRQAARKDA